MRPVSKAFTVVEFLMVLLILAVVAAVLVPNLLDFRKAAKNSVTQASVAMLRSAIASATAQIALKEDPTTNKFKFPTYTEMQKGVFDQNHPVLSATPIIDPGVGVPKNPWTNGLLPAEEMVLIIDCEMEKGSLHPSPEFQHRGWCYRPSTGEIWANSSMNGGGEGKTENLY